MDLSRNQESVGRLNTKCATCSKIDAAWQYCLHTADDTTIISSEFIETKASRLRYVGIIAFDNSDAALRWTVSPQSVTILYAIKSNIKQQKRPVQCFRATVRNYCDTSSKMAFKSSRETQNCVKSLNLDLGIPRWHCGTGCIRVSLILGMCRNCQGKPAKRDWKATHSQHQSRQTGKSRVPENKYFLWYNQEAQRAGPIL